MNILIFALLFGQVENPDLKNMPEPTKEINALIKELGNDSYHKREAASKKLTDIGWPALKACYKASQHEDLEIANRARRIYAQYFSVLANDKDIWLPSIWLHHSMTNTLELTVARTFALKIAIWY